MKILVIEDQKKIAFALRDGLVEERFSVDVASTGEEGYYLLSTGIYDLWFLI
jgi:DNA-binding response OmpR family regulator